MQKLGFGLMRLPQIEKDGQVVIDQNTLNQMVDAFLERGFTYFDTAYVYHSGMSEDAIREALVKRHSRDSFTLATKLPLFVMDKVADNERIFSEQLAKCGVDYFDYYLLHALGDESYVKAERLGCFDFVLQKKAEGKIKHVGFSFHAEADLLDRILTAHPEMEFVQIQLNYLDWEDAHVQSRLCPEVARKHGKPVVIMEPIRGGSLVNVPKEGEDMLRALEPDMSMASWAIRFAASQDGVMVVLSGMSTLEQMLDNTNYMRDFRPLTADEQATALKVGEIIRKVTAVPCTACRYCTDGCPMEIPIPEFFALYNSAKRSPNNLFAIETNYYENLTLQKAKASTCVSCGACSSVCPQHIDIPTFIAKVAEMFEH